MKDVDQLAQQVHDSRLGTQIRGLSERALQLDFKPLLDQLYYVTVEKKVDSGKELGSHKRFDLLVDDLVLIELEHANGIVPQHDNQLQYYM